MGDAQNLLRSLNFSTDRTFMLHVEAVILELAAGVDDTRSFPPMSAHFRRLVHLTAKRFGLKTQSDELWGLDKCVVVRRCPQTRVPALRYADFLPEKRGGDLACVFRYEPPSPGGGASPWPQARALAAGAVTTAYTRWLLG